MSTPTLTKHATGNIIKISLMVNIHACVMRLPAIAAAPPQSGMGFVAKPQHSLGSQRSQKSCTNKKMRHQQKIGMRRDDATGRWRKTGKSEPRRIATEPDPGGRTRDRARCRHCGY